MKINIIGAGVSGLCVGSYLQMQGFETHIFEKSSYAGGLCTSWKRGDYTFDGCIHWLMGTDPSNPFYHLWSELISMPSLKFVTHEERMVIEVKNTSAPDGSRFFHLYTSVNRLEEYLLELAPEDKKQILKLTCALRKLGKFEVPPMIREVPGLMPLHRKIGFIRHLPLLMFMLRWSKVTNISFSGKLKNPFLQEAFRLLFDGEELPLLIVMFPLACNDSGGAAYPLGGSAGFAANLEKKYCELGGKIHYSRGVKKIIEENGSAQGLLLSDNTTSFSDLTISAADWRFTFTQALEQKYLLPKMKALLEEKEFRVFHSAFMLMLGVKGSFRDHPHFSRLRLDETLISPDGTAYEGIEVHVMNYDPTLVSGDRTVISVKYYTEKGDFWIRLRDSNRGEYQRIKNEFGQKILDRLEEKIPGIRGRIEEMDIATPATFHRFTGNWKGSTQAWQQGKNLLSLPGIGFRVKGLKNFYYTSHWMQPGGGLPVALKSARDLAQVICHDHQRKFVI